MKAMRRLAGFAIGVAALGAAIIVAPPSAVAAEAPCSAQARACIQLSTNLSWLMENGEVTYGPVAIRHGKPGFRTPPGVFYVTRKHRHWYSRQFNGAHMPFSVFFNGGIAFHQGNLSGPSHGCVRMQYNDAQMYFNALKAPTRTSRGDRIEVVR